MMIFPGATLLKKSFGPFQSIETYGEVQNVFDTCDKNTLITFDVDDTIITTQDFIARDPNAIPWWFKLRALLKYPAVARSEKLRWIYSIAIQKTGRFILDQDIVPRIKQLQDKGAPVIALTFMPSGAVGIIPNMPEWRANMLKSFGIDFSGTFGDTFFTSLPQGHGDYPCLYKGILCTNQIKKGKALGAFLDYHKPNINHIISFDDHNHALDSIAQECIKRKISFSGYQMMGVKKFPGTWNTSRVLVQLDSIMQHGRWITDQEADAKLVMK